MHVVWKADSIWRLVIEPTARERIWKLNFCYSFSIVCKTPIGNYFLPFYLWRTKLSLLGGWKIWVKLGYNVITSINFSIQKSFNCKVKCKSCPFKKKITSLYLVNQRSDMFVKYLKIILTSCIQFRSDPYPFLLVQHLKFKRIFDHNYTQSLEEQLCHLHPCSSAL